MPKTCISSDELKRYLNEQLDESVESDLQDHIGTCPRCQQALEQMAAASAMWDGLRDAIGIETESIDEVESSLSQLKECLAPSEDPKYLGRIGSYDVCGVIGEGSTGIVLKALESRLNRFVAIKVLSPTLAASGPARRRFEREGRAIAAVSHDHVVPIYAVDEFRGIPYIVMQYIPGVSLLRRIEKTGSLTTCEVVRIGFQVASGLSAAHSQGIVHRDVKPANVILEETVDRAMVTDFGLARVADDVTMTRTGTISGTPQYMSPEQAKGDTVDSRTDLFSLGSLMYAACTSRAPFRAETVFGIIHRVCETQPRPIREINPDIDPWLVQFINKLMSKSVDDRFDSAATVAQLLEKELAHLQNPTVIPEPSRIWLPAPKTHVQSVEKKPTVSSNQSRRTPWLIAITLVIVAACGWIGWTNLPAILSNGNESNGDGQVERKGDSASRSTTSRGEMMSAMAFGNVRPDDEPVVTWSVDESDGQAFTNRFWQRVEEAIEIEPESRIVLDVDKGDIAIRQTELDYISFVVLRRIEAGSQAEAEKIASYHHVSKVRGDSVQITTQLDPDFVKRRGDQKLQEIAFGIGIPAGMLVELSTNDGSIVVDPFAGNLELSTRGGDVRCENIQGDIWARSVGGEVVVTKGCSGNVDLMSTHGNVCAAGIEGTARLRASNGNIYIGSNVGRVSAHVTGGDVRVAAITSETSGHVEVGSVRIDLDESPTAASSFSATNGVILAQMNSDVGVHLKTKGRLQGPESGDSAEAEDEDTTALNSQWRETTINGGGETIELISLTGAIWVEADREPDAVGLGGSGSNSPYFSLGGSGNHSMRESVSQQALEKTSGEPRPGAIVPVEVDDGGNIDGYALYLPVNYEQKTNPCPVIVYLQGGYGVGGQISTTSNWGLPRLIRDENDLESERNQLLLDTFIVVCIHIQDGNYGDRPDVVKKILDDVSADYEVDSSRIYVTGLSRGGHGTWKLCSELPGVFAAAVPIGGRADDDVDFSVFEEIPVWIAHNQGDSVIEFQHAESAASKIENGSDVKFERFDVPLPADEALDNRKYVFTQPDIDRHDAWTELYCSTTFYKWLLTHSR